jgi:hypothetical protein
MSSLNNLENLLQMATIEHMYQFLDKLKKQPIIEKEYSEINKNKESIVNTNTCNGSNILIEEMKKLNQTVLLLKEEVTLISKVNNQLYTLLKDLLPLQVYPKDDNNNIKLIIKDLQNNELLGKIKTIKIKEEKEKEIVIIEDESANEELTVNEDHTVNHDELLQEEQTIIELEKVVIKEILDETHEVIESEIEEDEEETYDYSTEEEVVTDEEEEKEEEKEDIVVVKVELEQCIEEQEQEEEEEEEEVFEIEIDDINYYATDEENGLLYEIEKDGGIGKKIGIIKDGEPIFN